MPGLTRRRSPDEDDDPESETGEGRSHSTPSRPINDSKRQRIDIGHAGSLDSNDPRSLYSRQISGAVHGDTALLNIARSRLSHKPGQIVRVFLQNFVTYTSVTFSPGPALNMVIGPNGTGKSTIVCAICIGLGWSTSHLGRAKELSEFVKHGCYNAVIEIELKGRDGETNTVIRREIQREGNKTTWFMNGSRSRASDVHSKAKGFNIQVDNLCHFLPQDRVVEFSQLSPVDRLISTQRAAADPEMQQWHEDLKGYRTEQREAQTKQNDLRRNLSSLEGRQSMQRPDVERLEERERIQRSVEMLTSIKPFTKWMTAKIAADDAAMRIAELKEQNAKLRREFAPAKAAENAKSRYKQDLANLVKHRQIELERSREAIDAIVKEHDEIEQALKGCDSEERTEEEAKRKSIEQVEASETRIADMKRQLEQEPVAIDLPAFNERMREFRREMAELSEEVQEKVHAIEAQKGEISAHEAQIQSAEGEIQELESQDGQRERTLKSVSKDTAAAWEWVKRHRADFHGQVFGPPIVECSIKDKKALHMVESCFQRSSLKAITCTDQRDFKDLSRQLTQTLNLSDVVLRSSVQRLDHPLNQPPLSAAERGVLGLDGWALDYIDGPEPVLSMLCAEELINQTGVSFRDFNENEFTALVNSRVNRWVTPRNICQVRKRQEYGDSAKSTMVRNTRKATIFDTQGVDVNAVGELKEKIGILKHEVDEMKQHIKDLVARKDNTVNRKQEINAEKDRVDADKNTKQHARNRWMALPAKIENNESELIRASKDRANHDVTLRKIEVRRVQLMLQHSDMTCQYAQRVEVRRRHHEAVTISRVAVIEADSELGILRALNSDLTEQENNMKQQLEKAKTERQNAKQRLAETVPALRAIKDNNPDLQEYWHSLSNEEQQRTPQELDTEIESQQARLDLLHEGNPRAIEEYKEREKRIRSLQQHLVDEKRSLTSIKEKIKKVRDEWEPRLDSLVGKISHAFGSSFETIGCAGEVSVYKAGSGRDEREEQDADQNGVADGGADDSDFENWAIHILVRFREGEQLSLLDSHRQSGGERAVSTIFYLMALQSLSRAPFRVVDEINQGMDPRNERVVHGRMVDLACGAQSNEGSVGSRDGGSQYFLITPKLLQGLKYAPGMKVHCIVSGEHMPDVSDTSKALDFKELEAPQSQPFVPPQGPAPYNAAAPQPAPQDPMSYSGYRGQPQPRPQFARFDTISSKGSLNKNSVGAPRMNEDSLPEMPSLNSARDRQVEDPSLATHDGVHEDGIPLREQKQLPPMASQSNPSAIDGSSTNSLGKLLSDGDVGPPPNNQGSAGLVPQRQYSSTTGPERQFGGQASASNIGVSPYQPPQHAGGAASAYYRGPAGSDPYMSPASPIEYDNNNNNNNPAGSNVYATFPPPSYSTQGASPSMPQRQNTSSPLSYARYYGSHAARSPSPSHPGLASPPPVQRYHSPQPQTQQQQLGGYSAYNAQALSKSQNQYSAYTSSQKISQQNPYQQTQDVDPGLFYPPVGGARPGTGHY
ncbi:MAG: Structural maintenance of chromosomes protein 5 [Alyxoria varia]|nr:MAG: Structural maintenance of chromosomes protein 5 [Alyxoria varia]